jgi:hypothetical protein
MRRQSYGVEVGLEYLRTRLGFSCLLGSKEGVRKPHATDSWAERKEGGVMVATIRWHMPAPEEQVGPYLAEERGAEICPVYIDVRRGFTSCRKCMTSGSIDGCRSYRLPPVLHADRDLPSQSDASQRERYPASLIPTPT